jgi:hypothetical protein
MLPLWTSESQPDAPGFVEEQDSGHARLLLVASSVSGA